MALNRLKQVERLAMVTSISWASQPALIYWNSSFLHSLMISSANLARSLCFMGLIRKQRGNGLIPEAVKKN